MVNCYHFVFKDTSYFQHNCSLSWTLCLSVNDLVVFVGGKGTNIWGEEKGMDDLPVGSDKAGIDSSL